jgi:Flp pilus assembly pilin Flp
MHVSSYGPLMKEPAKGASLIEYCLLVALILAVSIVAVRSFGTSRDVLFSQIASALEGV